MSQVLLNAALSVLVVIAGMSLFVLTMREEWEGREYFAKFKGHWGEGILFASITSFTVFSLLATVLGKEFWEAKYGEISALDFGSDFVTPNILYILIPLIILVYVMTFSAWTDMWSGHAPSEMAWLGIWLSMPFMVGYLISNDKPMAYVSLLIMGCVAFFLYFNRGLGDADVRLLWLINIATVWWVGLYWTVMLFAAASFLQIIVHAIAQKAGWGRLVELKYSKFEKSLRKFAYKFNKNIDLSKESRERRHVPFIPVMAFTWVIGLTIFLLILPQELIINNYWSFL